MKKLLQLTCRLTNMTISKKIKPGRTKDAEFKISLSTEDIDKIDEKIRDVEDESEKGMIDEEVNND